MISFMASEKVFEAIILIKSGDRGQARDLLVQAIKENPNNEDAWYAMAAIVGDIEKKMECLVRVLEINPKNDKAKRYLRKLIRHQVDNPPLIQGVQAELKKVEVKPSKIARIGLREIRFRDEWLFIAVVVCIFLGWSLISKDKSKAINRDAAAAVAIESSPPTQGAFQNMNIDFGFDCVPTNTQIEQAVVLDIIDGDTIKVRLSGRDINVKYIGIDAPDTGDLAVAIAKLANEMLVSEKTVILVKDVSETDQFDRLLRYVFVDDIFVNYKLVQDGFVVVIDIPPDTACSETFHTAEEN